MTAVEDIIMLFRGNGFLWTAFLIIVAFNPKMIAEIKAKSIGSIKIKINKEYMKVSKKP